MNVYQKLNQARVDLQNSDIKKSGKNAHLKFDYFELADMLPTINEINNRLGITAVTQVVDGIATMLIVNSENPEETITFTTPTAHAKLQGNASPIQETGSMLTYVRRYLILMAYEVVEHDEQDAQIGAQQTKQTKHTNTQETIKNVSEAQINRLYAIAHSKGKTKEAVKKTIETKYSIESTKELTKKQYDELISALQQLPDKEG